MIKTNDIEEMVQICADLTRQGIVFVAEQSGGTWEIHCTGH